MFLENCFKEQVRRGGRIVAQGFKQTNDTNIGSYGKEKMKRCLL